MAEPPRSTRFLWSICKLAIWGLTPVPALPARSPDTPPVGSKDANDASEAAKAQAEADLEQIKLEFSARMEEYKTLRAEVVQQLTFQQQTLTVTFTALGICIGTFPAIVSSNFHFVFFLESLLFYGLVWAQLRYNTAAVALSKYINEEISRGIQDCLSVASPKANRDLKSVLQWESEGNKKAYAQHWSLMPIEGARYIIPFVAGIATFSVYWVTAKDTVFPLMPLPGDKELYVTEKWLSAAFQGFLVLYTTFAAFVARGGALGWPKKSRRSNPT